MARVAVICGGSTPERNVSLAGAGLVAGALRSRGHDVVAIDTCRGELDRATERECLHGDVGLAPPSLEELDALRVDELSSELVGLPSVRSGDVLFLVLHGRQGEGGQLQSLFELAGLRYIGCDSVGSLLAMDKDVSKRLFVHAGIPTPDWTLWPAADTAIEKLGLPLIVKPSRVGSTVGLTVVRDVARIPAAVEEALRFDDSVLLERFIDGRELTVGVLGDEALAVGEILPSHEIFDYECKYTEGMAEEVFPADLEEDVEREAKRLALEVHRTLSLRDFSRVDFRLDPDGRLHCLEANTLPGMTPVSLFPQSAAAAGVPFDELCDRICSMALSRSG